MPQENDIIVVSGLPRSGTSMMMQMISRSGIEILTDHKREADISNPKGYYEYEPVKKLMTENSWLPDAQGKCVKIIAQLLPFLKKDLSYKVIFMDRDLEEVLTSQNVMLGKGGLPINTAVADVFKKNLLQVEQFFASSPNISVLHIAHKEAIRSPEVVAEKVAEFIGRPEMAGEMAKAVSADLYRNKKHE